MPANGQTTAATQLSNLFGFKTLDQNLTNLNNAAVAQSTVAQTSSSAAAGATSAPPNASAAAKKDNTFTGLCEALNSFQKEQEKKLPGYVADQYVIEFAPASLGDSTVKKPGSTDFSNTPNQEQDPNGKSLNPATNSVKTSARVLPVVAGTQIVQFIDQVMRNSSYISDQSLYIKDEVTGAIKPNANSKNGQTAWFKINVTAQPLKMDKVRNDHAYKMTFTITPYAINQVRSDWFAKGRYRGTHKVYNYWFTGENNSVLDFQINYNNLYRTVITGNSIASSSAVTSDPRAIVRKTFMPASAQSDKGAKNQANEPAANLADSLYSPNDFSEVKLKIVGDPAWMQQGEISTGVSARTFNFAPFNSDGGINFDSQEVVFSISFNRPTDYNFNTGIMEVNANNVTTGQSAANGNVRAQETMLFQAQKVRHTFSKGKFEQEITGTLLQEFYENLTATTNQSTPVQAPQPAGQIGQTSETPNTAGSTATDTTNGTTNTAADGTRSADRSAENPGRVGSSTSPNPDAQNQSAPTSDTSLAPQTPASPTTSNGAVVASYNNPSPLAASSAQLSDQTTSALVAQAKAEKAYFAAGSPQSGPIYNAYNAALNATDQAQTQFENAFYNTPGLKPVTPAPLIVDPNTGRILGTVPQPQVMAKDQ
jgi:hypothetical protein